MVVVIRPAISYADRSRRTTPTVLGFSRGGLLRDFRPSARQASAIVWPTKISALMLAAYIPARNATRFDP